MNEQSANVKKGILRYYGEYNVKDMIAMIRNNKKTPEICEKSFKGKFVIITGATSGIGYHTAHKYASMGAELLLINRNREKSEQLCKNLIDAYSIKCSYLLTDFSDLHQVTSLAEAIISLNRKVDVLIHNAGIYLNHKVLTDQGLETVFTVNHLSSFLLNDLLLPMFKKQKSGRIILVNSEGHRFAMWGLRTEDLNWKKRHYSGLGSYGSAKLAQLLTMLIFAEELKGTGVTINAMHPGAVKTESGKENDRFYKWYKEKIIERNFRSAGLSSEAIYYLGAAEEVAEANGKFFNLTTLEAPAPPALDRLAADEIFKISRELVSFARTSKKKAAEETIHHG
ncbi:SDR family NAD(P)-dependent oxidoreductase [Spirochaeta isovalerica]|uniref:NAD(P)-dependent dehydrogenase (Short-subunit alcohol dehydrogenase family) n=1 Tax=Spirochaeta isovalerica TaxID=150 RepID=A0A841R8Z8_9SPIO|nr:SDR family NAD(P)-dependent oxidoreductase [Spirochaeta isovalerica]MBB6479429.1 NAD(P)-dependent dehydrogenase (short-subunit alcohol dehydrogenase family) [Spirochaeta isovalerica]